MEGVRAAVGQSGGGGDEGRRGVHGGGGDGGGDSGRLGLGGVRVRGWGKGAREGGWGWARGGAGDEEAEVEVEGGARTQGLTIREKAYQASLKEADRRSHVMNGREGASLRFPPQPTPLPHL